MSTTWRGMLIVGAMVAGIGLSACTGDGDSDERRNGDDAPTATEVVDGDDGNGPEAPTATRVVDDNDGDDSVPVPDGADETSSGSYSSGEIPIFVPDPDFDADAFTNIEYKSYTVDDTPEDVIDFYRDRLSDWDDVFVFSGGAAGGDAGFGVWTKDDRAIWVSATSVGGETQLLVISGSAGS